MREALDSQRLPLGLGKFGTVSAVGLLAWALSSPVDNRAANQPPEASHGTDAEIRQARQWVESSFLADRPVAPFSFVYGGLSSSELLKSWQVRHSKSSLDQNRTRHTLTYTDSQSGLEVKCEAIEYGQYPAVEWVITFKNTGTRNTPILEKVRALDAPLIEFSQSPVVIHHARGSNAEYRDFEPLTDTLGPGSSLTLESHGVPTSWAGPSGSPSVESLPFFNLDAGGEGIIAGLGWTGPWKAEFERDNHGGVRLGAWMDDFHAVLYPAEEVRTPRILILFWHGNEYRGQNLWRRLILRYYSPTPGGKPFSGLVCDSNWGSWMTGPSHIEEIRWWGDHDLPMECYWMDAGWTDLSKGWEAHQSQQIPNPQLFPEGLKPVADAAHERGMKFLLWMVPESVHPAVGIGAEHPEWLGKAFSNPAYGSMVFHGLDHGDPQVNGFMIDYFSSLIDRYGIDIFRQDGLSLWPADTGPDRSGINQVRYTVGFYEFWDGLLKKHPDLLIDNCGCGARKLDLETIRRSVNLWRSDCQASGDFDPVSDQGFNYGLFPWVPLSGGAVPLVKLSRYSFRSAYCPAMLLCWPMKGVTDVANQRWAGIDLALLRNLLQEYLSVRPYLFGDYYPLTPYSLEQDRWMAWQFNRPDLGEGMIQAFRRPSSTEQSAVYRLHGLDPGLTYTVVNLDAPGITQLTGRELMDKGVRITLKVSPDAGIVVYKKAE
ncbi:MAG: alpha-galactosidase [Candidatus Omnitrophica bacterium]|nr:alpha-galactosidase [Candidatus Omnitrophota bacterium]